MIVPALVENRETIEDSRKILKCPEIQKPLGNTSAINWTCKIFNFPVGELTFVTCQLKSEYVRTRSDLDAIMLLIDKHLGKRGMVFW